MIILKNVKRIIMIIIFFVFFIFIGIVIKDNSVYGAHKWRVLNESDTIEIEEDTYIYQNSTGSTNIKVIKAGEKVRYYNDWTDERMKIYYDGSIQNSGWIDLDAIPSVRDDLGKYKVITAENGYKANVPFYSGSSGLWRVEGKETLVEGDIIRILDGGNRAYIECNNGAYRGYVMDTLFVAYGGVQGWNFVEPVALKTDGINPYNSSGDAGRRFSIRWQRRKLKFVRRWYYYTNRKWFIIG